MRTTAGDTQSAGYSRDVSFPLNQTLQGFVRGRISRLARLADVLRRWRR